MNHSCVPGEDDSVLIIMPFVSLSGVTLFIWTLDELPAPDEMHIRWLSFPSEIPTLASLTFEKQGAMNTLQESFKSMFVMSWQELESFRKSNKRLFYWSSLHQNSQKRSRVFSAAQASNQCLINHSHSATDWISCYRLAAQSVSRLMWCLEGSHN